MPGSLPRSRVPLFVRLPLIVPGPLMVPPFIATVAEGAAPSVPPRSVVLPPV